MKTRAVITQDVHQSEFVKGDAGYIDGYVQAADSRPYAAFVRADGVIDLVPVYLLRAALSDEEAKADE